uniref:Uncharacterized protein n=1 Tax=Panstrongylus lignarius TaxID=156445 RepID=A0A224XRU4_9HEMI
MYYFLTFSSLTFLSAFLFPRFSYTILNKENFLNFLFRQFQIHSSYNTFFLMSSAGFLLYIFIFIVTINNNLEWTGILRSIFHSQTSFI